MSSWRASGRADALSLEPVNDVISNWRSSHSFPLNTLQVRLREKAKSIHGSAIVAQRLKRVPSIIQKLQRFLADEALANAGHRRSPGRGADCRSRRQAKPALSDDSRQTQPRERKGLHQASQIDGLSMHPPRLSLSQRQERRGSGRRGAAARPLPRSERPAQVADRHVEAADRLRCAHPAGDVPGQAAGATTPCYRPSAARTGRTA